MKTRFAIPFLLACLSASVAMVPPVPTVKRPHKSAAVHQGAGAAKLISKAVVVVPWSRTFAYSFYRPTNDWINGLLVAWDTKAQRFLTNYAQIQSSPSVSGNWTLLGTTNRSPFIFTSTNSTLFLRLTPNGVWQ